MEISMECRRANDGSRAVIQVRDHGAGVPDGATTEIFRPFYQVPGDMPQDGSGLGLAITERIVRLHGGGVTAANAPEGGLIVTLELPMLGGNGPLDGVDGRSVRIQRSEVAVQTLPRA